MIGIKAKITKLVDLDVPPYWVECRFIDAWGKEHIFIEKVPIVTGKFLTEKSEYPQDGHLACKILEERIDVKNAIIKVSTENPWYIESTTGKLIFDIFPDQIENFNLS